MSKNEVFRIVHTEAGKSSQEELGISFNALYAGRLPHFASHKGFQMTSEDIEQAVGQPRLTCTNFCKPRGSRVQVDCLKVNHLVWLGAFADSDADHGVFLLWDHQHLKDIQRARQRKIKVLGGKSNTGICEASLPPWRCDA